MQIGNELFTGSKQLRFWALYRFIVKRDHEICKDPETFVCLKKNERDSRFNKNVTINYLRNNETTVLLFS